MSENKAFQDEFLFENYKNIDQTIDIISIFYLSVKWRLYSEIRLRYGKFTLTCELVLDHNTSILDDIILKYDKKIDSLDIPSVKVFLEIFGRCFEFNTIILDQYRYEEETFLVLKLPSEIKHLKRRFFPRKRLGDHHKIEVKVNNEERVYILSEISFKSVRLEIPDGVIYDHHQDDEFTINEMHLNLYRSENAFIVCSFSSENSFESIFNFCLPFKYPNFCKRTLAKHKETCDLYYDAGYMDYYIKNDPTSDHRESILETWKYLDQEETNNYKDMVLVKKGKIGGASSLAHIYKMGKKKVWAMHQMCIEKKCSSYDDTLNFYNWRFEYLAGLPSDNDTAVGWFSSQKKIVESMYVKFVEFCKKGKIDEVSMFRVKVENTKVDGDFPAKGIIDYGSIKREYFDNSDLVAGFSPKKLNMSELLDIIYFKKSDGINIDNNIVEILGGTGHTSAIVCLPFGSSINLQSESYVCDRYFEIEKEELLDFLSTAEHSIRIFESKKYKKGSEL